MSTPAHSQHSHDISSLVAELAGPDPAAREAARRALIAIGGHEVATAVAPALAASQPQMRWEAAKILTSVKDASTAVPLVLALKDSEPDVRWVASEAVAALGRPGLLAVLEGLTKHAQSPAFCDSAHHVLHELGSHGFRAITAPVIKALELSEPAVNAPPAAFDALQSLRS